MRRYYTGVGARRTPAYILDLMTLIAVNMESKGNTLRSGGAAGADRAFEAGAGSLKQIFVAAQATDKAMQIAGDLHPAWDRCPPFAKRLHGRNAFQILGPQLDFPSEMLICWTPDGCCSHAQRTIGTGGTGTAISIADKFDVPIYNMYHINHIKKILEMFLI